MYPDARARVAGVCGQEGLRTGLETTNRPLCANPLRGSLESTLRSYCAASGAASAGLLALATPAAAQIVYKFVQELQRSITVIPRADDFSARGICFSLR